ncbi:hypothetical protein B296_00017027 [Ensete ventricosum]|uniref:Uncharacterized protein n=1 Tax=Ensete ventricosum TaxID=4639 RepID=A0A427B0B5_ENSVE|nr:hypothetical protein B296_00017027 [Ensete ventricosum]
MLASAAEAVLTLVSHFPFIWWTGPGWVHVLVSAQTSTWRPFRVGLGEMANIGLSCIIPLLSIHWVGRLYRVRERIDPLVCRVEVRSTTAGRFRYARLSMQIACSPCEVARRPSLADAIILLPS